MSLQPDDSAVSPVIATILMVAIAVVLAAVIFIVVNDLGSETEDAPDVGFAADRQQFTLTVVRGPTYDVDWFTDMAHGGTCTPTLNGNPWPVATGTFVRAGDVIAGCLAGETLTVSHAGTNTLLYSIAFA